MPYVSRVVDLLDPSLNTFADISIDDARARVLRCPIDVTAFQPAVSKSDAFLIVSRLVHWKRVDYAVEAFILDPGLEDAPGE